MQSWSCPGATVDPAGPADNKQGDQHQAAQDEDPHTSTLLMTPSGTGCPRCTCLAFDLAQWLRPRTQRREHADDVPMRGHHGLAASEAARRQTLGATVESVVDGPGLSACRGRSDAWTTVPRARSSRPGLPFRVAGRTEEGSWTMTSSPTVRQLIDKDQIIDLVHRYSYCVDHRLYDEVVELFTEDCVV